MSYLVFARKFRPQRFQDIVGQEHITVTLQNAIKEKRIAQSFLFSGTRGVGKTSTARILAKALNCETGVVPEPCDQCLACREITQGNSLDVLEIDGASNRGIDEIRNLRENVKFKPAQSRFKVYIIDEVHMLTQEAFNALLKTLEEPPEHVKFIFATTELHKVPLTILSRCQKFVFRKVPTSKMVEKLEKISRLEKITCDEKALFAIAKAAEGSLRDAESLLDQVASFAKGEITYSKIVEAFGIPPDETYLALVDAVLAKDAKKVLEIFSPLSFEGKDMVQFVRGLTEVFRALLILKVAAEGMQELIELSSETCRELELRTDRFSKEDLLSISYILQNLLRDLRRSPLPELHVETTLIKLAIREDLASLSEVVQKLEAMREPQEKVGKPAQIPGLSQGNAEKLAGQPAQIPRMSGGSEEKLAGKPVSSPAPQVERNPRERRNESSLPNANSHQEKIRDGAPQKEVSLNDVERLWAEVVELVKTKKMSCGMFLSEAAPLEVEDGLIVLGLPGEFKFHKENLEKLENKKLVEEIFQSLLGTQARVSFVITVPDKVSLRASGPAVEKESVPEIVASAVKLFEGKIVQKK